MWRALKPWLPVALWMGVIFAASTDLGNVEHTSRFIGPALRWLIPDISPEAIGRVQFLVRKAAHFTEYAILALLTRRAAQRTLVNDPARREHRAASLALFITVAYAASDELHQSFVPGRTASPIDVLIDAGGACAALVAARLGQQWRPRRDSNTRPSV